MELTSSRELREWDSPPKVVTIVAEDGRKLVLDSVSRFLRGRRLSGPGTLDGGPVFFKVFISDFSAEEEASNEANMIEVFSRAGVSTPALLDRGKVSGGGHWLALRLISGCRTLKEVWEENTKPAFRSRFYRDLLELHAELYKAGFDQTDPHRENYIYKDEKIFAIDLGKVKRLDATNDLGIRQSLALLLAQFPPSEWDEMMSIGINLDLPNVDPGELCAAWRKRIRHVADKSLRSTSRNKVIHTSKARIICRRHFYNDRWHDLLRDFDGLDRMMKGGESLKEGNSATVVCVKIDGLDCVIKRYNIKNRRVWLKRVLGESRARNSWWAAHLLEAMGIPTPQPLAMVERRGLRPQAYLISRVVAGQDAAVVRASRPFSVEENAAFVAFFEAMKLACVSHGDCKATNFILKEDLVYVIDLDGVRLHRSEAAAKPYQVKDHDRFARNWQK